MTNRIMYGSTATPARQTTTSLTPQTHTSLSFTPSAANTNCAVFWSCAADGNNTADDHVVDIYHANTATVLQSFAFETKDSTDIIPVAGLAILEDVSTTQLLELRFNSTDAANMTAGVQGGKIAVLELGSGDVWSQNTLTNQLETTSGSATYSTVCTTGALPAANYTFICSAEHKESSSTIDPEYEGKILLWNDTANLPYGYVEGSRAKDSSGWDVYWYVGSQQVAEGTDFDLRAMGGEFSNLVLANTTLLALNLDNFPGAGDEHSEGTSFTSVTTNPGTVDRSLMFTSNKAQNGLLLVSALSWGASSTSSNLYDIYYNGVQPGGVRYTMEPGAEAATYYSGASMPVGFAGMVSISEGINTANLYFSTEAGSNNRYANRNVTLITPEGSQTLYAKVGGSFLSGAASAYHNGSWKTGTVYAKVAGAWKPVDDLGAGLTQMSYTDAASNTYYSTDFTPAPAPTPSPSPSPTPSPPGTCFVAGSLILMGDGTYKSIENVTIGDLVAGRWGSNKVLGLDRPLLGNRPMVGINGEVMNTTDHLTWTSTGWAVIEMATYLSNDYRQTLSVDLGGDEKVDMVYTGVNPDNVREIKIGDDLGHKNGFREVKTLHYMDLPPETQLYALVTDGDHTIHVNDYVFSGWANDEDYDYQAKIGE